MKASPDVQAPSLNRRKVGDYVVTYLSDGYLELSFDVLQGIDRSEIAQRLEAVRRPVLPHFALASFLLQGRDRTVLVDAGAGGFNGWGGRLPVALATAGVAPEDVDTILVSHGHVDHVGGLTLHGKSVFPNAEVVVHAPELQFWRDDAIMSGAGEDAKPFFLAARTAFETYDARLKPVAAGEVLPGVSLLPLPGHTPGHVGFRIDGRGAGDLLIWSDVAHMADIQIPRPDVTVAFDVDPEQARATRKALFETIVAERLAVAGMHLNMPGFLTLDRHGDGYVKVDLPWTPALL